jgi:Bacteriophage baseplate protein W
MCDCPVDHRRDADNIKRNARIAIRQPGDLCTQRNTIDDCSNTNQGHRNLTFYMDIKFPFQFDHKGRTAQSDDDQHITDMIAQVLFTSPGERVNRPTFGSGLMQLVFQPNSDELSATIQFLVQGALQQWLGDLIEVNNVEADNQDSTLSVTVVYTIRRSQQTRVAEFQRSV